jgi:hypothetical protein
MDRIRLWSLPQSALEPASVPRGCLRVRSWSLEGTQSTAVDGERMVVSPRPVKPGATTRRRVRVKFSLLAFWKLSTRCRQLYLMFLFP